MNDRAQSGFRFGVVLLGAGRSQRMGQPKLLLPWGQTTVLGYLLGQWRELGAEQIGVVCAAGDTQVRGELERLAFPLADCIDNPEPERGMFSSVQCAARWARWQPGLTHWCVVLGDQPHLRPETLKQLLELGRARPRSICQPASGGHKRHPVLMPKAVFEELAGSTAGDLKTFLVQRQVETFAADDPGLELDIDRPEDYQKARELYRKSEIRNPKSETNSK